MPETCDMRQSKHFVSHTHWMPSFFVPLTSTRATVLEGRTSTAPNASPKPLRSSTTPIVSPVFPAPSRALPTRDNDVKLSQKVNVPVFANRFRYLLMVRGGRKRMAWLVAAATDEAEARQGSLSTEPTCTLNTRHSPGTVPPDSRCCSCSCACRTRCYWTKTQKKTPCLGRGRRSPRDGSWIPTRQRGARCRGRRRQGRARERARKCEQLVRIQRFTYCSAMRRRIGPILIKPEQ